MSSWRASPNTSSSDPSQQEFKVVMVGTVSVGKTSLACRYVKNQFRDYVNSTIGASYMWKREIIDEREIKFSVWDTAGQEQFHSLVPMYFREADAVILVLDCTRSESLVEASMWLEKIQMNAPMYTTVFVALNKCDLATQRVVPLSDVEEFCRKNSQVSMMCAEVSAKTGSGVNDMFQKLGASCVTKRAEMGQDRNRMDSFKLSESATPTAANRDVVQKPRCVC